MKQKTNLGFFILVVVIITGLVSVANINAATTTTRDGKSVLKGTSTPKSSTAPKPVKVKISIERATKIAEAAHKGSKAVYIALEKYIYTVQIKTAKGKRTLRIGANTGKILKDTNAAGKK